MEITEEHQRTNETNTSMKSYLLSKSVAVAWELYSLGLIYHGVSAESASTLEKTIFVATGIASFYGSRMLSRYHDLAFYKPHYEKKAELAQKDLEQLLDFVTSPSKRENDEI